MSASTFPKQTLRATQQRSPYQKSRSAIMLEIASISFIALLVSLLAALLWDRARLMARAVAAEERAGDTETVRSRFRDIAAISLRDNNQAMIDLARGSLQSQIEPLQTALKRMDTQVLSMEKTRQEAYGRLSEQIDSLKNVSCLLGEKTGQLEQALKGGPRAQGQWGEMQLRRVVELAGLEPHCDFVEQAASDRDSRLRPDLIVRLPGARAIIVDAKAPMDAFLSAASSSDQDERRKYLEDHAKRVRNHMKTLESRGYHTCLDEHVDCVVMFLPTESLLAAAVEADAEVISRGAQCRVLPATPTTLIALLHAVALNHERAALTENAHKIQQLGSTLYSRLSTLAGKMGDVGRNLARSVNSYNELVGSFESRALPAAHKLQQWGGTGGQQAIEAPRSLDHVPRPVSHKVSHQASHELDLKEAAPLSSSVT